jgi:hypothetical protein
MYTATKTVKHHYSEREAAATLCISLESLHKILDEHVFTPDHPRPEDLDLTYSELLLLSVWAKPDFGAGNVVEMPHRV